MRALKYKGTFNVGIDEVDSLHAVKSDDVVVKVKYCGICGTDVGIICGDYPVAVKGVTLGHEATGTVVDVGSSVRNVRPGDNVVINPTYYCGECRMCRTLRINHCERKAGTESGVSYDGTFADFYRTTSDYVLPIPEGVSMKAMALTEPLSCILAGIRKIPGTSLGPYTYVFGAGPMGILYSWALMLKGITPVVI
ncbi:MAG: alcohol dehydrogenase catalytic domain-containing protein, partial [Oligoflexales bacterium]|nr:alcohol dehydrogenase catalytic domain-containing protein [Oligoflexales bacterium]